MSRDRCPRRIVEKLRPDVAQALGSRLLSSEPAWLAMARWSSASSSCDRLSRPRPSGPALGRASPEGLGRGLEERRAVARAPDGVLSRPNPHSRLIEQRQRRPCRQRPCARPILRISGPERCRACLGNAKLARLALGEPCRGAVGTVIAIQLCPLNLYHLSANSVAPPSTGWRCRQRRRAGRRPVDGGAAP